MTPNEITTLIATHQHKELDIAFKKVIYERVKYWRATLIKQSLDKTRLQSRFFQQVIYIPLERFNRFAILAPQPLEDWEAKTIYKVPLPIRITDAGVFNYVGGMDGRSPFGLADVGTISYLKSGKYSGSTIYHTYYNNDVYTSDLPDLPMVMISGVFNEPEEAMKLETGKYVPDVNWWDRDIPMSGDIDQRVVQCILSVDFADKNPQKQEDYQIPMNGEEQ